MTGRVCALVMVALLTLEAGCKSPPRKSATYTSGGNVSARRLQAPANESYQADSSTTYTGSNPAKDNAVPQYPAGLLSDHLAPVSVTVRVIVDVSGVVTDASITGSDQVQPEFARAVLAAVLTWRFEPLKRMTAGAVEALPFSQQYRFVFTQVNGRAVVTDESKQRIASP